MLTEELIRKFNQYFTIQFVNTDALREDMYRLRYDVYIDEFRYEDPNTFMKPLEKDEYDEDALACLIYHRESDKPVACVRMIHAVECKQLPVEKFILNSIYDKDTITQLQADRASWGEVSRLAVSKSFRRRSGELATPIGADSEDERTYPLLSVACFLSCIALADMLNIDHVIAAMEPVLPRLIRRTSIKFKEIGELIEYHGKRKTYVVHKNDVLNAIDTPTQTMIRTIEMELMNQMLTIY